MLYNKSMDCVYILGSGSLANNEELRLSLRSLHENMIDLGKIYVVGEDPGFLPPDMLFHSNDCYKEKWKNAYHKVCVACGIFELSDDFLLMNDDFFMIEPFEGAEFPFYALKNSNGGTCGQHSFHIHCPIRLNKEMYLKMPFSMDQKACRSPRTFYGNFYKAPPKFCGDFVVHVGEGMKPPEEQIVGLPCFSIGDHAMLYAPFRKWLEYQFTEPSPFEK